MYPLTSIAWPYRGCRYRPTELEYFFEIISWQVTTFQMTAGSSSYFLKYMWNKLFWWAAPLKFWFQTDLERKNSAGFYMQGRQSLLTFLTMVTRWPRSSSNFYALIGQNLTGEFMWKMYAASANFFCGSWSWQSFVSPTCHDFNFLFSLEWIQLLSSSSVIHGWFVYWIYGWQIRRLSKLSEIQFRMALFSFFTLLDA